MYYDIGYHFLLENPNTLFFKLPLEILAKIMKFLNQLNFQWNYQSAKVILDNHYRNLIVRNHQSLIMMEWETQWVCHSLPQFVVTLDIEFLENNTYIRELNIRRKKSKKNKFWNMRSRTNEKESIIKNKFFVCKRNSFLS